MAWLPERWPRWQRWLVRIAILLLVLILLVVAVLLWIEWRPPDLQETPVHRAGAASTNRPRSITVLSWNIGYAGLGREADFFADGGKQVRPPSQKGVRRNLAGVKAYLKAHPTDVVLLQEVDSLASRTFSMNQVAEIAQVVPGYAWSRALNFKVRWIPVPVFEPLGRVESGLLSLTRYRQTRARRHQIPGQYAWPVRVFHLKRCLHEVRFKASDGRDWVLLHLHLSAFDKGGGLRQTPILTAARPTDTQADGQLLA